MKDLIENLNDQKYIVSVGAIKACEIAADALEQQAAVIEQMRSGVDDFLVENDTTEFGCSCCPGEGYVCGVCRTHERQAILRKVVALNPCPEVLNKVRVDAYRAGAEYAFNMSGINEGLTVTDEECEAYVKRSGKGEAQ